MDVTSPAPASSTPPVASSPASTDSSPSPSPVLARECAGSGLRLVLAPSATPAMAASAKLLISLSSKEPLPNDGDIVEFSPASSALVFEIGAAIGRRGGGPCILLLWLLWSGCMIPCDILCAAGLVIDYGRLGPYGASVRGIQAHKFVDFLESPGEVDLVRINRLVGAIPC